MRWLQEHKSLAPWLVLFLSLCSVALTLIATAKYGAGVTPDSVNYLSTAENFAKGNGMITYSGSHYTHWPPLYVCVLSIAGLAGISFLTFATWLNAVIFGFIVLVAHRIFMRQLQHFFALGATALIALSYPILHVSKAVWSEPLFILLVLISFWQFHVHLEKKTSQSFLLLCIAVALAPLQRYAGIVLPIAAAVVFFTYNKRNFVKTAIILIAGFLPLSFWLLRNKILTGFITGPRAEAQNSFLISVKDAFSTFAHWFGPAHYLNFSLQILIGMFGFAVIVFIVLILWRKKYLKFSSAERFILLFSLLYALLLFYSANKYNIDRINTRLLSTLFPVLVFFIFRIANTAIIYFKDKWIKWLVNFFLSGLMLYHFTYSSYGSFNLMQKGAYGYNTDRWHQSQTIDYVAKHYPQFQDKVYSNAPDAIWFFTDKSTSWLHEVPDSSAIVIYFDSVRTYLPGREELETAATKEIRFDDGSVFIIE